MPRKRRSFSAEFKVRVVLELISGKKSLVEASREYNIREMVLSGWKQEFVTRATQVFEQPQDVQEIVHILNHSQTIIYDGMYSKIRQNKST